MRYGKFSRNKQNLYIAFVDFMFTISIKGVEKGPYHLSINKLAKMSTLLLKQETIYVLFVSLLRLTSDHNCVDLCISDANK